MARNFSGLLQDFYKNLQDRRLWEAKMGGKKRNNSCSLLKTLNENID